MDLAVGPKTYESDECCISEMRRLPEKLKLVLKEKYCLVEFNEEQLSFVSE